MSNPVGGLKTPFKRIVVDGQGTTESSRSNHKSIYRFAQGITEKQKGSPHAIVGHVSRSNSVTASMRSSSTSSGSRQLDRRRRQKGDCGSGTESTWSVTKYIADTTDWLFSYPPEFASLEKEEEKEEKEEESSST